MEEQKKYNGFKLISLDIRENPYLTTVFYDFIEDRDDQKDIYSTVVIGPNGTGKSNLFRVLIDLFNELYWLKQNERTYNVKGRYILTYAFDNIIYKYTNIKNLALDVSKDNGKNKCASYYLVNDEKTDNDKIVLPTSIIANSIMLTDKYPNYIYEFPIYKYLGVRSTAQSASTRSYVRKTVEFVAELFNSEIFRKGLLTILDFLGVEEMLEIYYETLNTKTFFDGDLNVLKLQNYFENIRKNYSDDLKRAPFKLHHYIKIESDKTLLNNVCSFCNLLYRNGRLKDSSKSKVIKEIPYNILNKKDLFTLKEEFPLLETLRQLGMIKYPEINLQKTSKYSLKESSSGEYHFLSSMIGLMATMEENSLIFIDEPEVSLHPNWQMKYLATLRLLFKNFSSSHQFIATHSHFLISDLEGKNSKIIPLRRENGNIEILELPDNVNTFGWSAEQVLLDVFDAPTTRNFYIAEELGRIFEKATNKNENLEEYKEKLLEWHKRLNSNDPLHYTIEQLIKRMGWLN